MTAVDAAPPQRLDAIDTAAALYLAVPVALFCTGWLQPLAGLALGVALLVLLVPFFRPAGLGLAPKWLGAAALLAFAWSFFGGAGHFLYANAFDWVTRDAVLRDLGALPWPVYYSVDGGPPVGLRAPLGYFLAPAALAKLIGLASADVLLYLWTALGVTLFACLGLQATQDRRHRLVWLLLLPWFSGMDALGWVLARGGFHAGEHLEWWAMLFQYSSDSTLLFWAPNHALPGWIAAGWLLKHWQRPTMWAGAVLLLAAVPLWAPLLAPAVGVFGLAWLWAFRARLREVLRPWAVLSLVAALAIALCTGLWVSSGTAGSVPAGFTIVPFAVGASIERLVRFALFEWLLLGLLFWQTVPRTLLVPTVLLLAVLPFFRMGLANDLVMRGSIIPLAILWWHAAAWLVAGPLNQDWRRAAAAAVLAVGAITPLQEVWRAVAQPRWKPELARSFPEQIPVRTQPHYFVDVRNFSAPVAAIVRSPQEAGVVRVVGVKGK